MPNAALIMTDPGHDGKLPGIGPIPLKTRSDDAGTFQLHGSSIIGATQLEEQNDKRRGD
jgi:hypothetical protein